MQGHENCAKTNNPLKQVFHYYLSPGLFDKKAAVDQVQDCEKQQQGRRSRR